jgi:hypothetical protein
VFDTGDDSESDTQSAAFVGAAATSNPKESDVSFIAVCSPTALRKQFQEYVKQQEHARGFTNTEVDAIKLLSTLRKTKASLGTYDSIMHWHLTSKGSIYNSQTVRDSTVFITRQTLYTRLRERYNFTNLFQQTTKITLPHSKAKAQIVWSDAQAAMSSLLTDPRITDDHYLFFEDNPLASPPERLNFVEDVNTGRAYTQKPTKNALNIQESRFYCP